MQVSFAGTLAMALPSKYAVFPGIKASVFRRDDPFLA